MQPYCINSTLIVVILSLFMLGLLAQLRALVEQWLLSFAKWSQHQGLRHEMIAGKMQPIQGIDIERANHCRLLYLASRTWSGTSAAEMRDRYLLT